MVISLRRKREGKKGNIYKYKARICSCGNFQIPGVDYNRTSSPSAWPSSVRLVMSVALGLGWKLFHIDVEATYLNGKLYDVVYARLASV